MIVFKATSGNKKYYSQNAIGNWTFLTFEK